MVCDHTMDFGGDGLHGVMYPNAKKKSFSYRMISRADGWRNAFVSAR